MLTDAYAQLGLEALADEAFRAMVLARIVEPTSKADSLRVLADLGAPAPALRTLFRSLKRCRDNDYRDRIAKACTAFSAAAGGLSALVMYDCTTLHFETSDEDAGPHGLRKVGMSKEHRVDPQAQVGLLVDPSGFPLEPVLGAGRAGFVPHNRRHVDHCLSLTSSTRSHPDYPCRRRRAGQIASQGTGPVHQR